MLLMCLSATGGLAAAQQWFAWCNREVVSYFSELEALGASGGCWAGITSGVAI